jgi:hypothetical protein
MMIAISKNINLLRQNRLCKVHRTEPFMPFKPFKRIAKHSEPTPEFNHHRFNANLGLSLGASRLRNIARSIPNNNINLSSTDMAAINAGLTRDANSSQRFC